MMQLIVKRIQCEVQGGDEIGNERLGSSCYSIIYLSHVAQGHAWDFNELMGKRRIIMFFHLFHEK